MTSGSYSLIKLWGWPKKFNLNKLFGQPSTIKKHKGRMEPSESPGAYMHLTVKTGY